MESDIEVSSAFSSKAYSEFHSSQSALFSAEKVASQCDEDLMSLDGLSSRSTQGNSELSSRSSAFGSTKAGDGFETGDNLSSSDSENEKCISIFPNSSEGFASIFPGSNEDFTSIFRNSSDDFVSERDDEFASSADEFGSASDDFASVNNNNIPGDCAQEISHKEDHNLSKSTDWKLSGSMADSIARIFVNTPNVDAQKRALEIAEAQNCEELHTRLFSRFHESLQIGRSKRKVCQKDVHNG